MTAPSLLQLETATLSSWPALTTALDGMWLARLARGYTKRANSICCLDPADSADAEARLDRMVALYAQHDREALFRVTPFAGAPVVAALDRRGWSKFDETLVLAMPLTAGFAEPAGVKIHDATDRNWLEGFAELGGLDRRSRELLGLLVGHIAWPQAGLLLRDGAGDPVAAALAVDAGGIGVYHNVVVRADRRGNGLGRAIMHAALNWTRGAGATHAAIQVVGANQPAIALYGALGFAEVYRYHYRSPA